MKIDCTNLTPAQQKLIESIPAVLHQMLAHQIDSKTVLAKIDECFQGVRDVGEQQASRFNEQAERLSEIMTAVERLGLNPESLLARYRLGYVIFDIDYRNDVFPYRSKTKLDKYELDWSGVELTPPSGCPPSHPEFCGPDYIAIRMPGIRLKGGGGGVSGGWKTVFPKKPSWQRGMIVNDIAIDSEILAVRKDGIVFLIGFN